MSHFPTYFVPPPLHLPQLSASSSSEPELDDDLKSPISLVHERALRRGLTVQFEVVRETGPPHMRTFLTRCRVGEFATQGAGNGKKVREEITCTWAPLFFTVGGGGRQKFSTPR